MLSQTQRSCLTFDDPDQHSECLILEVGPDLLLNRPYPSLIGRSLDFAYDWDLKIVQSCEWASLAHFLAFQSLFSNHPSFVRWWVKTCHCWQWQGFLRGPREAHPWFPGKLLGCSLCSTLALIFQFHWSSMTFHQHKKEEAPRTQRLYLAKSQLRFECVRPSSARFPPCSSTDRTFQLFWPWVPPVAICRHWTVCWDRLKALQRCWWWGHLL